MDTQERTELRDEIISLSDATNAGESHASVRLADFLAKQNPIDIALVLSDLDEQHQVISAFDSLQRQAQIQVLPEADPRVQALLLLHVGDRAGAELVSELEPDDAADLLEVIEEDEREGILGRLEVEDAHEIRQLRTWGPDTAGGLMTTGFLSVGTRSTCQDVFAAIRRNPDVESVNNVYVVDPELRLVGVVSIRQLLLADPMARVSGLQTTDIISVSPEDDREEVVRVIERYHLSTLPVVDGTGRMLGMITGDDAMTVLEEEASEDVMTIAGTSGRFPTRQSVLERVRARVPWLMITLGGVMSSAFVIQTLGRLLGKEETISPVAWYLPVVAGLAGNVAMQSAAVMVRGFATGEIDRTRLRRLIGEETLVGVMVGLICGSAAGFMAWAMGAPGALPLSVGLSVLAATSLAGGSGTIIPSMCDWFGIDPAISAGPFITTLNDVLGFSIYMIVALAVFGVGAN